MSEALRAWKNMLTREVVRKLFYHIWEDHWQNIGKNEKYDPEERERLAQMVYELKEQMTEKLMAEHEPKKTILKYEIKDYSQDNNIAVVTVELTGVDLSEVNVQKAQENAMLEYSQYINDHFTELNDILNKNGEEAMKKVLVKELSSMLFNNLNTEMDKTKPKQRTVDFYLKKIDGEWKIASPNNENETNTD